MRQQTTQDRDEDRQRDVSQVRHRGSASVLDGRGWSRKLATPCSMPMPTCCGTTLRS